MTTKPNPVAYTWYSDPLGSWGSCMANGCEDVLSNRKELFQELITTTQSEVYAEERVKEALDEVMDIISNCIYSACDDDHELGWSDCAEHLFLEIKRIRNKEKQ